MSAGNSFGYPETLKGTNNNYWVVYLPKIDVSFVSEKKSDIIQYAHRGYYAQTRLKEEQKARSTAVRKAVRKAGLEKYIKTTILKFPDSYEHVETQWRDMGDHVIVNTSFRAKNVDGEIVLLTMHAEVSLNGQILKITSVM